MPVAPLCAVWQDNANKWMKMFDTEDGASQEPGARSSGGRACSPCHLLLAPCYLLGARCPPFTPFCVRRAVASCLLAATSASAAAAAASCLAFGRKFENNSQ